FRHDRVDEDEIYVFPVGDKLVDRILAVYCLDHPVTKMAEDIYCQLPQGFIVLAHKNGFSAALQSYWHIRPGFVIHGNVRQFRKIYFENRSVSRLTVNIDEAIMFLDDPVSHSQSEPGPLSLLFRSIERLKDV